MVCRNLSAFADAPRAGSAEAKELAIKSNIDDSPMHPVQAAPRQRTQGEKLLSVSIDAPRAGSAEAKASHRRDNARHR